MAVDIRLNDDFFQRKFVFLFIAST